MLSGMKNVQPVLVSGEITIETTLAVDGFPVAYHPVHFPFFQMNSSVAGVGVNQGAAYRALGREARLLGLIGRDLRGDMVLSGLDQLALDSRHILRPLSQTTQSLILFDPSGKRMIWNDLKDIQEAIYPVESFLAALEGCGAAVLCNLNFNRPLLPLAKERGIPVVTDVHVTADPEDPYNREFMAAADVLFLSNELFPGREKEFAGELIRRYSFGLLVIGLGAHGALLWDRTRDLWHHSPGVNLRPVVNTIGAGDALSACFTDGWLRGLSPEEALDRACRFAGWKVGARGAAEGFLTTEQLQGTASLPVG